MSYYRNTYLKSDHWNDLRVAKLAATETMCAVCGQRSLSNDVHHIDYKGDLYAVTLEDLRVLCRPCHQRIHEILDVSPSLKLLTPRQRWTEAYRIYTDKRDEDRRADRYNKKSADNLRPVSEWTPVLISLYKLNATPIISKIIGRISFLKDREDSGYAKVAAFNSQRRAQNFVRLVHATNRTRPELEHLFKRLRSYGLTIEEAKLKFPKPGDSSNFPQT